METLEHLRIKNMINKSLGLIEKEKQNETVLAFKDIKIENSITKKKLNKFPQTCCEYEFLVLRL